MNDFVCLAEGNNGDESVGPKASHTKSFMMLSTYDRIAYMALALFFQRIVTLPVWWYGRGLSMFIQWLSKAFSGFSKSSGLRVWMKNLFVPMYGDTSFTGRAISVGIRLVMIVVRGLGALLFAILLFCLFVLYLIVLPVSLLGFFYHLLGFFS